MFVIVCKESGCVKALNSLDPRTVMELAPDVNTHYNIIEFENEVLEDYQGKYLKVINGNLVDLGKATLRPESSVELNKLRDYLVLNPTLKIELGGHTDTRGDAVENMTLSSNRAKAVYDYLIAQGIVADRLAYKGYGETVNRISDAEIAKLATDKEKEAAHQKNRRTEYKIIK